MQRKSLLITESSGRGLYDVADWSQPSTGGNRGSVVRLNQKPPFSCSLKSTQLCEVPEYLQ